VRTVRALKRNVPSSVLSSVTESNNQTDLQNNPQAIEENSPLNVIDSSCNQVQE
jgi:hypothetical protein